MCKLLLVVIWAWLLLLSGCSTVVIDTAQPDGTACHAERIAWFMSSSAIAGDACGGSIGADNSKADAAAMATVLSAAIAAAMKSASP